MMSGSVVFHAFEHGSNSLNTVDHRVLFKKSHFYGIREKTLK